MQKGDENILQTIASKAEWNRGLVTKEQLVEPSDNKSSFKYFIAKNAFKKDLESRSELDAIYFNDISPVIYIKQLTEYNPNEIIKFHNRFWNEGRTPLSLIITPQLIKILDNFSKPIGDNENIHKIQIGNDFSTSEEDLKRLSGILHQSKLDSELVIGESLNIKIDQRVDRKLIEQLRQARKILHFDYNLDFSTIHDLLGRSLFTLYLEHRDILTKEDILSVTGKSVDFFSLLKNYPIETYQLFTFLKDKFNGDLFPITEREISAVNSNSKILSVIYDCYTGEKDLRNGQFSFFRLFNFKHIPIELISAIYEEFMSEEDAEKRKIIENQTSIKRDIGAYYTPQMLVEFVYNEILPMPSKNDHNFNIKILDPACGSGIFLVEGFKRLIERWKFSFHTDELTKNDLLKLLRENIFGIELHPEAIKIAAFSLYLTFLQYMNPRDILRKVKFEPLIFWTKGEGDEEYDERNADKSGFNLLRANTFIRETDNYKTNTIEVVETFFKTEFNLIVGNPPWRRSKVNVSIVEWAEKNAWEVKKDIVKAYLVYAPFISKKATIALISSAKVLFNTTSIEDEYRTRFFKENKVSVVVNFSVVRNVLFEKAKQAAALIIYQHRLDAKIDLSETVIYVVPKTQASIKNRKTITIDASEIKHIPLQEIIKTNSKIFKIAMYGGFRDLKLINILNSYPKIQAINHIEAVGLNNDATANHRGNPNLGENIFIDSRSVESYYIPKGNKPTFMTHPKYNELRSITKDIFSPPLITIKIGNNEVDICSAYIDYPCAYETYLLGLKFPGKSVNFHKAFVTCLNSSLARYYYILISGSWGVDRGRVQRNELLDFPLLTENFPIEIIDLLSNKLDLIIAVKNKEWSNSHYDDLDIYPIKNEIDEIIYKFLNITLSEQALIKSLIKFSGVAGDNYRIFNAENPIDIEEDLRPYAQTYIDIVNAHYKGSSIVLKAEIFTKSDPKDQLASIKFYFDKTNTGKNNIEQSEINISEILAEINEYSFKKHNASIFYRRFIKYDLKNAFYLIKPNQKRFWTTAFALNDADDLIVEILNQKDN